MMGVGRGACWTGSPSWVLILRHGAGGKGGRVWGQLGCARLIYNRKGDFRPDPRSAYVTICRGTAWGVGRKDMVGGS